MSPAGQGAAGKSAVAIAPTVTNRREMGAVGVLITIFACLLIGHLAIASYFPSVTANAIGVVAVTLIIGRVLLIKNDVFSALLIIFFCSHFDYANNQGGLFNLVAFLLLAIYLVAKPPIRETGRAGDATVMSLLLILAVSNLLGLILRNPMPLQVVALEAAASSAYLLAFYFAASLKLTGARLRVFLIVASVMAAYNFAVCLNQHYALIQLDTPLLGLRKELFYATTNAYGVFASASSTAQYSMMLLALILPLLAASASRKALNLLPINFVPIAVMCALTMILANMRAAVLESGLIVVIYTIMFSLVQRRFFRNAKYVNMASAAAVIVLGTVGVWLNLDNISEDFKTVDVRGIESIESGKALNRYGPWQFGWERLKDESWVIGYGHGNVESNQIAWGIWRGVGGQRTGGGHLHNLYLALPMMYGWTGAIAYVLLFLVVLFRLWRAVRRQPFSSIATVTCLGFLVSVAFFLIDEVKSGNAVQTANYPMVMWIWLGLGLSSWRTLKAEVALARLRRQAEESNGAGAGETPEADRPIGPGIRTQQLSPGRRA